MVPDDAPSKQGHVEAAVVMNVHRLHRSHGTVRVLGHELEVED
jgi:hypothetical protein